MNESVIEGSVRPHNTYKLRFLIHCIIIKLENALTTCISSFMDVTYILRVDSIGSGSIVKDA